MPKTNVSLVENPISFVKRRFLTRYVVHSASPHDTMFVLDLVCTLPLGSY